MDTVVHTGQSISKIISDLVIQMLIQGRCPMNGHVLTHLLAAELILQLIQSYSGQYWHGVLILSLILVRVLAKLLASR